MDDRTLRTRLIRLAHENLDLRPHLLPILKEATFTDGKLLCDMEKGCTDPVTHIDNKGFAYCTKHGEQRKSSGRTTRKLRPAEIKKLEQGETLKRYGSDE